MNLELSSILIMVFIITYVAIINFFSILFRMTGLTKGKTTFQVISLFTGAGFTTSESEIIVNENTRRKIAMACMITGNVFSVIIVSLIVNLLSSLTLYDSDTTFIYIGVAFVVFVAIFLFFRIPFVKTFIAKFIEFFVIRLFTKNKNENFLTLLDNYGDNAIVEVYINCMPEDLKGKSIFESKLKAKANINILMIKRKGRVINVTKDTMIQEKDEIVVFGSYFKIREYFLLKNENTKVKENEKANVIELIDNYGEQAMVKVYIKELPHIIENKSIEECKLKALYGINIMMIKRDTSVIDITRNTMIQEKDEIIVFGPFNNINYLFVESSKQKVVDESI